MPRSCFNNDSVVAALIPELRRFIAAQVATGRHPSAGEVVRVGLRLLTKANRPRAFEAASVIHTIIGNIASS
jgi:putative addiction module CopG family antidote